MPNAPCPVGKPPASPLVRDGGVSRPSHRRETQAAQVGRAVLRFHRSNQSNRPCVKDSQDVGRALNVDISFFRAVTVKHFTRQPMNEEVPS
jgi:hypothetical protein